MIRDQVRPTTVARARAATAARPVGSSRTAATCAASTAGSAPAHSQPFSAVPNQIQRTADRGRQHRHAGAQGFLHYLAERLIGAGMYQQVQAGHRGGQVVTEQLAGEVGPRQQPAQRVHRGVRRRR